MSNLIHVCLFNMEEESTEELRTHIESLNFVRLAATAGTSEELVNLIQSQKINLIFFHLDPNPDAVVEVIEQAATRFSDIAMIAVSHQTEPDAILGPMRAGCDQFVCEPIDHADLAAAVARAASKRALVDSKSRCICVTGSCGGAGVTSIAANLALEIGAITDRECALVDMDLQFGDLAVNFDCEPRFTFYDLGTSGTDLDRSLLVSSLAELPSKVALLARPALIQQHEHLTPEIVARVIQALKDTYENTVVDMPRHVNDRSLSVFTQCDHVLIVCQLNVPSIRNAKRYLEALTQLGVPENHIEFVVNRGDSSGGRVTKKDLEDTIKKPVFASVPNDFEFVARSIDFGQPIASVERNNPVRAAIRHIAERILGEVPDGDMKKTGRRGLLGRLLSK